METVIPDSQTWKPDTGIPKDSTSQPTGVFFYEQNPEAIINAIKHFESIESKFDPDAIRSHAQKFDGAIYTKRMKSFIQEQIEKRPDPGQ